MSILSFISNIFKPAADLVDELHTSDEEKMTLQANLNKLQNDIVVKMVDYETRLNEHQAKIIQAETNSQSWLTRNWRPITMITFVALVVFHWLGLTPDSLGEAEVLAMFDIVKIGLGGYVAGRSVEKVVEKWPKKD